TKTKYREVDTFALEEQLEEEGQFHSAAYSRVEEFFHELTGEIHKTIHWGRRYFEYEIYYYAYERLIANSLVGLLEEMIVDQLPEALIEEYEEITSKSFTGSVMKKMMAIHIDKLTHSFLSQIEEEYMEDLLRLADIPFDSAKHREMYELDLADRERKKAEELAELQRKKEEEERMLDDIFGREYSPSVDRDMKYVLHIGETNTGKTHHALEKMKEANSGLYLAPLRLLALEVYDKLNHE